MLVYRKKESAKENVFPGEESVPSHIVDQVKAHNIKLAAERLEYETVLPNIITLNLFSIYLFNFSTNRK